MRWAPQFFYCFFLFDQVTTYAVGGEVVEFVRQFEQLVAVEGRGSLHLEAQIPGQICQTQLQAAPVWWSETEMFASWSDIVLKTTSTM